VPWGSLLYSVPVIITHVRSGRQLLFRDLRLSCRNLACTIDHSPLMQRASAALPRLKAYSLLSCENGLRPRCYPGCSIGLHECILREPHVEEGANQISTNRAFWYSPCYDEAKSSAADTFDLDMEFLLRPSTLKINAHRISPTAARCRVALTTAWSPTDRQEPWQRGPA
jgi:hypothetical protein